MPDGPLLGNGDVGVVLAGPPEAQCFYIGKNEFGRRNYGDASVMTVGRVSLGIPALRGASYHQEQSLALAEVRGTFAKDGLVVQTRSWVDANQNLLVTSLHCEGKIPLQISIRLIPEAQANTAVPIADTGRRLNIGRELYGGGHWYFDGVIDDVQLWAAAPSAEEIRQLTRGQTLSKSLARSQGAAGSRCENGRAWGRGPF